MSCALRRFPACFWFRCYFTRSTHPPAIHQFDSLAPLTAPNTCLPTAPSLGLLLLPPLAVYHALDWSGADFCSQDDKARTPLMLSALSGAEEAVNVLSFSLYLPYSLHLLQLCEGVGSPAVWRTMECDGSGRQNSWSPFLSSPLSLSPTHTLCLLLCVSLCVCVFCMHACHTGDYAKMGGSKTIYDELVNAGCRAELLLGEERVRETESE